MKTAIEIVNSFMVNGFETVEGECTQHGQSKRLVRVGAPWNCSKCFEIELAATTRAELAAKRNDDMLLISRLPNKFMGSKWPAVTAEQKAVRGMVRQFRDFIVGDKRWAALIFTGITGTGKTWLASELGEALIRNLCMSVRYVTAQGIVSEIQATYGKEGKSEEAEIEKFVRYDLLIIDEADVKRDNANASLLFTEVINRRYLNSKPVLMITNQAMENLEQFVGDRVFSRLHENAFVCSFDWADFRRAKQ